MVSDALSSIQAKYGSDPGVLAATQKCGPGGDCSSFSQSTLGNLGIQNVPRTAIQQFKAATPVTQNPDTSLMNPGDLVFFDNGMRDAYNTAGKAVNGGYVNHVGVYLGNGNFVADHGNGDPSTRTPQDLQGYLQKTGYKFMGAGRFGGEPVGSGVPDPLTQIQSKYQGDDLSSIQAKYQESPTQSAIQAASSAVQPQDYWHSLGPQVNRNVGPPVNGLVPGSIPASAVGKPDPFNPSNISYERQSPMGGTGLASGIQLPSQAQQIATQHAQGPNPFNVPAQGTLASNPEDFKRVTGMSPDLYLKSGMGDPYLSDVTRQIGGAVGGAIAGTPGRLVGTSLGGFADPTQLLTFPITTAADLERDPQGTLRSYYNTVRNIWSDTDLNGKPVTAQDRVDSLATLAALGIAGFHAAKGILPQLADAVESARSGSWKPDNNRALIQAVAAGIPPNDLAGALGPEGKSILENATGIQVPATPPTLEQIAQHMGVDPSQVRAGPEGKPIVRMMADSREVPVGAVGAVPAPPLPDVARGTVPVPPTEATGLSRAYEDTERIAQGKEPTAPMGTTRDAIAARGQELLASGAVDPAAVIRENRVPTNDEGAAILAYKRELANRSDEITTQINSGTDPSANVRLGLEQDKISDEMELISQAAQRLRGDWHQGGMLLQTAFEPDYSVAGLRTRAKAANLGEEISPKAQALIDAHAATNLSLTQQLAQAKAEVQQGLPSLQGGRPTDPQALISRIRQATGAEARTPVGSGMPSKQSGAVDLNALAPQDAAKLASDIRALAKHYYQGGATTTDAILKNFSRDLPHLSQDNVLDLLSGKYKAIRQARTSNQIDVDTAMNTLRRNAVTRQGSFLQRAGSAAYDVFNSLSRNTKLAIHASAPFMQGRKVLFTDPQAWLKSWKPMLDGYISGDKAASNQMARFQNDPMWHLAQESGLGDVLAKQHGKMSEMEESLAGTAINNIPGLGKIYEHSGAAFNGFLNEARWQMFKKVAGLDPTNPAYLRDMANQIGTLTGRSISKTAKAVSPLGSAIFSPRYTVSKWEFTGGRPLVKAETGLGRQQIAMQYGKVAAANTILALMASEMFKGKVDTDPKSTNFGHVTLGNNVIDLFGQEGEPVKLAAQVMFGKLNQSGKMEPASMAPIGDYIKDKMTPIARLPLDATQGIYNGQGNQTKGVFGGSGRKPPFDYPQELRNLFEPITIQSSLDEARKGATAAPFLNPLGIQTKAKPR